MDVISLHQHGIKNAVASLGTAFTQRQGETLKRYCTNVIVAYDSDAAGRAAALRGMDILRYGLQRKNTNCRRERTRTIM